MELAKATCVAGARGLSRSTFRGGDGGVGSSSCRLDATEGAICRRRIAVRLYSEFDVARASSVRLSASKNDPLTRSA